MRKLASIQKIRDIQPIPKADRIELATVLGWKVVVKKGEFQIGDLCVYCEIDSVFPEMEKYEFLRNDQFRIRTKKLRGQISQGICFPLNSLPNGNYQEGSDVTELMNVKKHEEDH